MFKKCDLNGVFKKPDLNGVFKKLDRDGVFKNLIAMACLKNLISMAFLRNLIATLCYHKNAISHIAEHASDVLVQMTRFPHCKIAAQHEPTKSWLVTA